MKQERRTDYRLNPESDGEIQGILDRYRVTREELLVLFVGHIVPLMEGDRDLFASGGDKRSLARCAREIVAKKAAGTWQEEVFSFTYLKMTAPNLDGWEQVSYLGIVPALFGLKGPFDYFRWLDTKGITRNAPIGGNAADNPVARLMSGKMTPVGFAVNCLERAERERQQIAAKTTGGSPNKR